MDIGTGIAIAGIWMLPVTAGLSKYTDGITYLTSVLIACGFTYFMVW